MPGARAGRRATDIHIEPFEHMLRVRYRIDGILSAAAVPETIRHFRDSIISRIKIMADLDIAERRLPQDGRICLRIEKQEAPCHAPRACLRGSRT